MNHSLKTRVLALALAVAMVFGFVPVSVFAEEAQTQDTTPETVTVKFDVNGGIGEYEDQEVTLGDKVAKPEEDPTHETDQFAYWTADLDENVEWNFDEDVVTEAMTLYATWITPTAETESEPVESEPVASEPVASEPVESEPVKSEPVESEPAASEPVESEPVVSEPVASEPVESEPVESEPVESEPTEPEVTEAVYTVQHYLETAEGYVLDEAATETLTGVIGETTNAAAKTYEGYTAQPFEQGVIAADGSAVVSIYYMVDPVAVDLPTGSLPSHMTIITDDESTLAPGVTLNEIALYDSNGDRVEMYVTTVDTTVDTVAIYANYKDNQCAQWGLQTLSEQVAAMEANYEEPFKVVAGINASYYNTTNGAPTGAFVMEGVDASASGDSYPFFAVLQDGTYLIGAKGEYSAYKGQIKEAIGGWIHLVKDGEICSGLDAATKYPRQTIGMTADGKVILMTADGSQAPQTIGLTVYEQAEVMLALGCVEALHLDGGNSATFGTIPEGSDKFVTTNSPSGGAERAVSNTLMIVSTAVADGTFDHAVINSDHDYFLPGSTYTFSAFGVDATNASAEIPETAVWTLSDDSFGTIENGTFVSNGKLGEVSIQMSDNGKVVGTKTVEIVHPTAISFSGEETTVPYGKTAELKVTAMYGNSEAFCQADAFSWTIDPEAAGTLDGFSFTAAGESEVSDATVTSAYKFDETVAAASINVKFGKGSEVLFDFEDGDVSNWQGTDTIHAWVDNEKTKYPDATVELMYPENYGNQIENVSSSVFLATEANGGRVKSGDYALGVKLDRLNAENVGGWIYNYLFYTGDTQIWRDVANGKSAVRVGMWVNMPQNGTNTAFRICRTFTKDSSGKLYTNFDYMMSDYDGKKVSYNTNYGVPESGWIYVYFDLTAYDFQSSLQYNPNEDYAMNNGKATGNNIYPSFIQFINGTSADDDTMEELVIYIDDITLDYSDVTDDRDAPVISNMTVSADGSNDVTLDGQTVTSNLLSFGASIADASGNSNATGLNYSSAKIYVDGMDLSGNAGFKASGSSMSLNNVYLNNGQHTIAFVVCDNQGNETRVTETLTVNGSAENAVVSIAGHNDGNNTPEAGSVYYIDVKASDAAQVEAITTTLKLNSANSFEYGHLICAKGVAAQASYDALNRELTLTITHDGTQTGEATLVSVPVRVWAWDAAKTGVAASTQYASGAIPVIDVECQVVMGKVTYAGSDYASYINGFANSLDVATKLDNASAWHSHTATAADDVAATCTESGYTGRTYCDVCVSVVDWGTDVAATGHAYELTDGTVKCACGELFNGVFTDGKTYVDGVVVTEGWQENSYYQDGVKLTGIHKVPAPDASGEFYYNFGEDGICKNNAKYTGLILGEDGKYYYSKLGELAGGWNFIDDAWYHFDTTTYAATTGEQTMGFVTYAFEETGKLKSGVWMPTVYGMRYYYGPDYYYKGWQVIDGKNYYFENGIRLEDGYQQILNISNEIIWYSFDEEGVCDLDAEIPDGFYTDRNGYGYSKDGKGFQGLQLIDGTYYYFDNHGYAMNNGTYAGRLFKDAYAAYTGFLEKDSVKYYYQNGVTATYGLYQIDNAYYFIYWGGVVKTSGTYYVNTTHCDLPAGNYRVDDDGTLTNGIVEVDGTKILYVNGRTAANGLYKIGEDYYYATWGGVLKTDGKYYVDTTYCDLPVGTYEFGADGKLFTGVVEKDGVLYLYQNGKTAGCGLYELNGEYYYSYWGGVLKTDGRYYVSTTYCDLPANKNYSFDAEGKMLNGVEEVDGVLYLYQNGTTATCGLFELDGEYYYAYWGGVLKTDGRYYVENSYCDLPGKANYSFDAEGKMLSGMEEVDGTLYLYQNGTTATCGLFEIDGEYYYAYWGGVLKTDGRYYVSTTYCDLPVGNYSFGADGKMLSGVEEVDGVLYLYQNGTTATCGLYELNGDYYYAYWGGVLKTDGRYYVSSTYCDLPVGSYTFGADGKMLNGFVTEEDGIYYYVNGNTPAPGLIYQDGYYYYVNWGGKLVTNQTFYVSNTNGYTIPMNYTFDELGRLVK